MNKESEFAEKEFVLQWFKDYIKQQYSALLPEGQNFCFDGREANYDNDTIDYSKELFEKRKRSTSSTNCTEINFCLSDYEIKKKIEDLRKICLRDDVDLLNLEDIVKPEFIQGILEIMKPDEFSFNQSRLSMSTYVHI